MSKKKTPVDAVPQVEVSGFAGYTDILNDISRLLREARISTGRVVNSIVTVTYWEIGRRIVEYEQKGAPRAEYGAMLLKRLAADLTSCFGRGFGYSNLNLFRQFYLIYQERTPILQSVIGESSLATQGDPAFSISWTHYRKPIPIKDREFIIFRNKGVIVLA